MFLVNPCVPSTNQSIIHLRIPSSKIFRMKLSNPSLSTSRNLRFIFIHLSLYKNKSKFGARKPDLDIDIKQSFSILHNMLWCLYTILFRVGYFIKHLWMRWSFLFYVKCYLVIILICRNQAVVSLFNAVLRFPQLIFAHFHRCC